MTTPHPLIDQILDIHSDVLKQDIRKYKNHVYRVYELTQIIDPSEANQEKYAIAGAFHDLGIWTNNTFDYLNPSVGLAKEYLKANGKEDWIDEISLMIDMHHKLSKYEGKFVNTVETFRRADSIDVMLGLLRYGVKKSDIRKIRKAYSNSCFHWFLIVQSTKNFFKHPLNPLPMFKR